MPNGHHHDGHGTCEHSSNDSNHVDELGIQYSLYKKIDMENLECLNEATEGSAKLVFKPYEERLNFDKVKLAADVCFNVEKEKKKMEFSATIDFSLLRVMLMKSYCSTSHSLVTLS